MECYYIVISSAHLSNGHFRNIKGVFRGPLSKNGNKTLDYAGKKNTIAKALEDLKANFYCELCDKQYYKHQEFDNHINSYDHAHKQRLKELKQREFARNVASKSRKDERKQEKALQRLHKLAELRKERACAPGSGPMFKSTTVTVQDDCHDIPKSAAVDSARSQDFSCTLMHDAQNCKDIASVISAAPGDAGSHQSDPNKCGDQVQGAHGHRVGFSFAFPKKAAVKLESSAAVFYEFNEETSMEHGFSRRSRFVPGTCNLQSPSAAEIVVCPEEKHSCFHPLVEKCTDTAEAPEAPESKELSSEESRVLESPAVPPAISHSKLVSPDTDVAVRVADSGEQRLPLAADSAQVLPLDGSGHELQADRAPVQEPVGDCSSLQAAAEENWNDRNSHPPATETEIKNLGADAVAPSLSEEGNGAPKSKPDIQKRPCQPFVPVLSKYGSNVLQWPSEMLIYTSTDPSISYSCNPLYFDFKSSRASESQEKPKHQPNIPHLHHETESNHILVSDFTKRPTSECCDYEVEVDKNVCNYTIPLLSDVSLFRDCDLAKNQNKVSLDESFRIRKIEKYHISHNPLRQNTVIDEKYNKVWIKEGHEKWLHKNRKRKRRRKLCHCHYHHCGDTTVAEMEMSPVAEKEVTYRDENKHQHLQNAEKCRHDPGNTWLTAGEVQQSLPKLGTENGPKRIVSASDDMHWDRGWCDFWRARSSGQHHGCKAAHRRSKASSRRQARQLVLSSGRHSPRHPKTCCSCKGRRSSCSPEQRCSGQCNEEKGPSHNQPIKRGYSVVRGETPEKPHRKRRQHTYSYSSSSDESSLPAEEYLRQGHALGAYHKAKGKRRKRKARIHRVFLDRNARSESSDSSKESSASSTLNVSGDSVAPDNLEETNAAPRDDDDDAKERDETMELEESKPPLEAAGAEVLGEDKAACAAMESTAGSLPDASSAPAPERSAAAAAVTQGVPREGRKAENANSRENQARYKAPVPSRPLEPTPPKSYLCHYELAEEVGEAGAEWVPCSPAVFGSPPPLPFKEAHLSTFLSAEQLRAPFPLPEQALLLPADGQDKFKELVPEPFVKVKLAFAPPGSALPPPPPLRSASVTTIQHTVLQQQHGALKVLQPPQQFLSQVPALSRAPLAQLGLCPAAFVAPPPLPLLPPSVLPPAPLAFPALPHFPSLLAPAVIPLQPLF